MSAQDNVFSGPNSVVDYFDPDKNPPLPLVEIPDRLNPFREDGVRIYAKMLSCLPAQNVKSLPALKMLREKSHAHDRKIVEASSGSTVLSFGIIARVLWGNEDVDAYVTNKKPPESLNLLRFFGIRPCLYGGLAQQEPTDPTGIMCRLRRRAAQDEDMVYPGQYDNSNNWKAHEEWTGPQIFKQLPQINVFCSTVGTGGVITGTGVYLKSRKPSVKVLGVFNKFGDPTPGPRHFHGFHTSGFPWQGTVDSRIEVSSVDSYRMSMRLSREGLICGPSSGEALHGLLEYISMLKHTNSLGQLRDGQTGEISCVFTCSDLPYQYLPIYHQKLGADEFPPIEDEILLQCDQNRHDERWILDAWKAASVIFGTATLQSVEKDALEVSIETVEDVPVQVPPQARSWISFIINLIFPEKHHVDVDCCSRHSRSVISPSILVLDLRSPSAFKARHIPGSFSVPLAGLTPDLADGDLFGDARSVHMICMQIQKAVAAPLVAGWLRAARESQKAVVCVCYNGDASKLASSALRALHTEAFSIDGGMEALWPELERPKLA
ncbi:Cysteine synthase B [Colletotrichum siamense]|uniref:Cysteine synthase B n=1 Tax=Colletotrichum siamense TaxID=690259 RepID=A0A9P5K6V3_COLSI|nr:Cysteine synthase B [Colletotrichum siamense]KAF4862585.1 Cysteine synthase B [Colletotrichum siamense]